MRKKLFLIFILFMLTIKSFSYSIEGQWRLTHIQQSQLSNQTNLKVYIKQFVFREKAVRWSLSLQSCTSLKVMMDIQTDNIYIDMKTIYVNNSQDENCTSLESVADKRFQDLLSKVYTFQIIQNFMIFSDAEGSVVFKFQRIISPNTSNPFLGTWIVKLENAANQDQMVEISQKQIVFCERQAVMSYSIVPNNIISFQGKQANLKCSFNELFSLAQKIIYFARRNNSIQLYDKTDNLLGQLQFVMDFNQSKKLRQQQKALQSSVQPTKPSISIGMADLIGKWEITSVLQGPNILENMAFIISNRSLLIAGSCNSFTYSFSASGVDPIKIKRQGFIQSNNPCENEDQKIYKNALIKMSAIKTQVEANKIILKILDDKNKQLFTVERGYTNQPSLPTSSAVKTVGQSTTSTVSERKQVSTEKKQYSIIKTGRYTILLLKNRDIPRKIIDIIKDSFSIQICNSLKKVSFSGSEKQLQLKMGSEVAIPQSCSTSTQNIFLSSFSKIASFKMDQGDVILLDKNQDQIIALNFITDL